MKKTSTFKMKNFQMYLSSVEEFDEPKLELE